MEHKLDPSIFKAASQLKDRRKKTIEALAVFGVIFLMIFIFFAYYSPRVSPVVGSILAILFIGFFLKVHPYLYRGKLYDLLGEKLGWKIYRQEIFFKKKEGLLLSGKPPGIFQEIIKDYISKKNFYEPIQPLFLIWGPKMPIDFFYFTTPASMGIFFFPLRVKINSGKEVIIRTHGKFELIPICLRQYPQYKTESNDFNKRFIVKGGSKLITYQILHPATMEAFLKMDFSGLFVIKDQFLIIETQPHQPIDKFLTIIKEAYSLIDHINDAFAKDLPEGNLVKQLNF